jgi:hypothetical protein
LEQTDDAKNRFYFTNNGKTILGSRNGYEYQSSSQIQLFSQSTIVDLSLLQEKLLQVLMKESKLTLKPLKTD